MTLREQRIVLALGCEGCYYARPSIRCAVLAQTCFNITIEQVREDELTKCKDWEADNED